MPKTKSAKYEEAIKRNLASIGIKANQLRNTSINPTVENLKHKLGIRAKDNRFDEKLQEALK